MIVICCGMYRAASTWQYNVASRLVEQFHAGERLGYFHDGTSLKQRLGLRLDSGDWFVIKAHEPDPFFAELADAGAALSLYGYRDIRDVAYSVAHKRSSTFEREIEGTGFLAQTVRNYDFWTRLPGMLSQRYEHVTRDPVTGVRDIASFLGLNLPAQVIADVAAEFSLENNRQRTRQLTEELRARGVDLSDSSNAHLLDEATQLHWNHIRDGIVGGWRQTATPRQIAVLARGCGRWLIDLRYEPDWAWVLPALDYLLFDEPQIHAAQLADLADHLRRHQESNAGLHEQLADLADHLRRHQESNAGLHEHLASERSRAALIIEELEALRTNAVRLSDETPQQE